ncbi:MAG: ankyrin repeat domain-containing protein [Alphaproteobacteria bacterium]|nr:ankyrin repeat domain-containing protein [Alphaproteobacteria bacterium]MDP6829949.1 ankyrin repeat domain-containing protein [Alphaproteobacteria bacterium]MDP6871917.1 ankyrin repeat domain-containing protein [Alphaproteobacteria bacterium]
MDDAVTPAAAAAIRAVRQGSSRIVHEDRRQNIVQTGRRTDAAKRAVARYESAADQGYVMALYNLARAQATGHGTERNYKKAAENFRAASMQGNIPAMLRLAEMHLAGLGGPEDRVAAQALYYVVAGIEGGSSIGVESGSSNDGGAARAKTLLATHLDNEQLQEARDIALRLRSGMPAMDLNSQRSRELALLAAAASGDLEMVENSLKTGVDANAIDELGRTATVSAAWRGHKRVIQVLIDSGVEIDAADNQGRTALTWAAINGHPEIVEKLLAEVATVDVRDEDGLTPLIRAAWNGHEEIVAALIASAADVNATDNQGVSALRRAETQNETRIIEMLRAAGAR